MLSDYGEKYNFFLLPLKSLEKAELLRQIADHVNGSGFAQHGRSPLALRLGWWGTTRGSHLLPGSVMGASCDFGAV